MRYFVKAKDTEYSYDKIGSVRDFVVELKIKIEISLKLKIVYANLQI